MNLNLLWAGAVFDELKRAGVREAVICPGSRSAPLAVAASEALRTCVILDERSAAFFALGAAKVSQRPVVVLCTSGSAGAHFLPAILEAEASGVPLIAITADRPPELHGFGAPQTFDQQRLFGAHAGFLELGAPDPALIPHLRATVAQAARTTRPLHLNAPFREPLAPIEQPLPQLRNEPAAEILKARGVPKLDGVDLSKHPRGVVFCGPRDANDDLPAAARELARSLGYALIADAASQLRGSGAVSHADLILRSAPWAKALQPGAVVRLGGGTSSKIVQAWLEEAPYQVIIRERAEVIDPLHRASLVIDADAPAVCRALTSKSAPGPLAALFARAEQRAQAALETMPWSEPFVAREAVQSSELLYVSSSMPVRDLDAFGGTPRGRVLANRGLNGIDGIVSSAAGAAWSSGTPATALLGDLALLHDLGGLIAAAKLRIPLRVLCVNNDGGGIFHFLPIAEHPDVFEPLFGTPHGMNLQGAAVLTGAELVQAGDAKSLRTALGGLPRLQLIEARTDRKKNVEQHRALQAAVIEALGDPP
ncbi:MAG TPA: 2-succinyl-5-enolpyruvyl-6-hydroxy-3-cyclohexene-1-carboxylic-acid synthase [Myxococcales bacterium]|nr:2-succinyl-5-enolpyruvyl-6-hydroxy-3-cyclohexene-1-carboxylic-acid synthase [Myxococcales bacterium]